MVASKNSAGSKMVLRQCPKTSRLMTPTIVVQAPTASTTVPSGMPGRSPSATGATASPSSAGTGGSGPVCSLAAAAAATSGRTMAAATRA